MTSLADTARRFRAGLVGGEEFSAAFLGAELFCRAGGHAGQQPPEAPAFMAVSHRGATYVPMYTSLGTLAAREGPCLWFSAPAAQLLGLLPVGCGVLVDPGADSQVVLPATAIRRPASQAQMEAH